MDSTQPLEMRGQQEVDGVANQMEETTGYDGNQMDETGRDDTYLTARGSIQTTRTIGHVGAAPSSLAGLAKGKKYFVDPYTPFTPRPATLSTRDMMIGPPMSTYRSNHWITQTSPAYIPRRLQNHRIPRTPPEIKRGFPATEASRPSTQAGHPRFMVDAKGHLLGKFKKPGRSAFPAVDEVGGASWTFKKMGYV